MIRRLLVVCLLAGTVLAALPGAGSAQRAPDLTRPPRLTRFTPLFDLFRAARATFRFHSVEAALAAGYRPASPCVASPAGGMGIHFENAALMADDAIQVTRPEILLYAPRPDGSLEFLGLEYWKRDADQNLATASDRPSLFGRRFDGPMEGHSPVMPIHYDLHVWLWKRNPSGLFAPFNPLVHCP